MIRERERGAKENHKSFSGEVSQLIMKYKDWLSDFFSQTHAKHKRTKYSFNKQIWHQMFILSPGIARGEFKVLRKVAEKFGRICCKWWWGNERA